MSVLKRLSVLREDADREPLPQRKFFHIGLPEVMDDLGECIPMIAWMDDNLSRFIVADAPSSAWARATPRVKLFPLPNRAVKVEDGIFLVSGAGHDHAAPHPNGKGQIHFVHLGSPEPLWGQGTSKLYVYRLDGVQLRTLSAKK